MNISIDKVMLKPIKVLRKKSDIHPQSEFDLHQKVFHTYQKVQNC